jgi:hypothetical protein
MADIKQAFGTTTAMTFTIGSLTSSGTVGRESTVVDNTTTLYIDALVDFSIGYPNSAPANDKAIYVYCHGSLDGTNYIEGLTGADAGYTIKGAAGALTTGMRLIGVIPAIQNVTARYGPFSIAQAFGGVMPAKWGLVLLNYSGQTLGTCSAQYRGVYQTVI